MQIHLIRHPQPLLDKGYCYGRSDIGISDQQLQACHTQLLPRLPSSCVIYSSPLQRCARLAEALARSVGAPAVIYDADLQELDFGRWEQRRWEQIAWDEVEAWNQDLLHHAPGGGETLLAMAARVWRSFARLRADAMQRPSAEPVVVCHGGVIRLLQAAAFAASDGPEVRDTASLERIATQATTLPALGFGEMLSLPLLP